MTKELNWGEQKTELLSGLDKRRARITEACLEAAHNDQVKTGGQILTEGGIPAGATGSYSFSRFDKLLMPLIRRVTPALFAMDLVGVQPLSMPVGMVRTLRFTYGDNVYASGTSGPYAVIAGTEADGTVVYNNYSLIAVGEAYNASNSRTPDQITAALESQAGDTMKMNIVKQTVTAQTRKLSSTWSIEADQDAKALDGVDIENEMVIELASEIAREKDRELLGIINGLAGTVQTFDFSQADGRFYAERLSALTVGFSNLSNQIGVATLIGGANWMVISPNVLVGLRNANNGSFAPASADAVLMNNAFVGTFNGVIKVYMDKYAVSDYVLLGNKGMSEMATGLIYCPYIELAKSGIVIDPTTMDPVMSVMSRYAYATFTDPSQSLGNSAAYFGRASIANLALGF